MNILDTIIERKKEEVADAKRKISISQLRDMPLFNETGLSLYSFLTNAEKTGIIAEFKRRSPSKGLINGTATVQEVVNAYSINGASAISVLTDTDFFGGSLSDLSAAVATASVPVLRKEFIIDEYQIAEAKAYGASVILLIAACLSKQQVADYAGTAKELGLEVLLEIHDENELAHVCNTINCVGVNNRNLKTFTVDIQTSLNLVDAIVAEKKLAIAESGIHSVETIVTLRNAGFSGFLIGENFMKETNPAVAFAQFVNKLKALHT
ncbi:MAG: indole-3-glycerol phosphate synthase TrpC [Chitinophagaceae bacterium]